MSSGGEGPHAVLVRESDRSAGVNRYPNHTAAAHGSQSDHKVTDFAVGGEPTVGRKLREIQEQLNQMNEAVS